MPQRLLVLILTLLATVPGARAQPPVAAGGQFLVNSYTTSNQNSPSVAAGPDGNFVVVWESNGFENGDTSSASVQGQRYASNGDPLGGQFLVNSYTTNSQISPSVAVASDGDFVVVWTSYGSETGDTSSLSVQGQRYASDGDPLGAQFQVNSYTTSSQIAATQITSGQDEVGLEDPSPHARDRMCERRLQMPAPRRILRLRVQILDVQPPVWRRIEVRANATFWALHVALQNAMGWTDSHLHDFELPNADAGEPVWIGMPDLDGDDDREVRADFDERLDSWIHCVGERFFYNYDYGDGWRHEIVVEALEAGESSIVYPRCLAGERACPPEDVGGPRGYGKFLEALSDPNHEEHEQFHYWIGGSFDPEAFEPEKVKFENPLRQPR